ncbi:MAG TPA: hypothetical protein VJN43_17855 [Bryobacteraceae bacterium]|nr:hypothetical protein [Bryobacteraceae bacterium]
MRLRCALLFLLAGPAISQSLRVVSEFQRFDPFGQVVAVDRTAHPREVLSPALARNAFASFHIAVTVPERAPFFLFVQTNPPDAFQISLYEELYVKTSGGWIPDPLEPVKLPVLGSLPYLPSPIPGQKTLCYWMDLWVPADTPVRRVRVEVLLKIGRGWVMYPMEVRVMPVVAPDVAEHHGALPPVSARADASVYGPVRNFICNAREAGREERLTVRRLIHRNALQDMALAHSLAGAHDASFRNELLQRAGGRDREAWCKSPLVLAEQPAEWYLHVRDWLYRMRGSGPR